MSFTRMPTRFLPLLLPVLMALPRAHAAVSPVQAQAGPSSAGERFIYISDLDDTAKLTNVKSTGAMLKYTFLKKKAFAGMPGLYQELEAARTRLAPEFADEDRLTFVSNSPSLIRGLLAQSIHRMGFPKHEILLRDATLLGLIREQLFKSHERSPLAQIPESIQDHPLVGNTRFTFKYLNLERKILSSNAAAVLLGDDGEFDYEIYTHLKKLYPERIARIYIHRMYGRTDLDPSLVTVFSNAFEIALHEFNAGRLDLPAVENIGQDFLRTIDRERVHPLFAKSLELDELDFPETPRAGRALEGLKHQVRLWIQSNGGMRDWRYELKARPAHRPPEFSRAHAVTRVR